MFERLQYLIMEEPTLKELCLKLLENPEFEIQKDEDYVEGQRED